MVQLRSVVLYGVIFFVFSWRHPTGTFFPVSVNRQLLRHRMLKIVLTTQEQSHL